MRIEKIIRDAGSKRLFWAQPKTRERRYELRSNGELLATLEWEKQWGSLAHARAADGDWTFKRAGFLNPRVTIRRSGSDLDLAVFCPSWRGDGTLEFPDGRKFRWAHISLWRNEWSFRSLAGKDLVRFHPSGGTEDTVKEESEVEIHPAGLSIPEISLLVLLGWYLMILQADDEAAAAAGTTAALG